MTIINNSNWDKVQIELNNHETLLLLQALKSDSDDIREMVVSKLQNSLSSGMKCLLETAVKVANDKIKLHNELLPCCFRSDYEHLKLEPIELD